MRTKYALVLLFVAAFLIRLIGINQSLWLDEGTTARVVQTFDLGAILTQFAPQDFHPPLFYFVEKLWTTVFGYSEWALRLPSVIFSLLAGYMVYLTATRLWDKTRGLWAAAFFLFNPLVVYYSQEARMYAMVTFLLTAALYCFIVILEGVKRPIGSREMLSLRSSMTIILFNTAVFLSFLTFYGSVFLIGAFYLYLLLTKRFKLFFRTVPGIVLAAAVASPLLLTQLEHSREALALAVNWKEVLGQANLKNLLLIPLKFAFGRISFYPKILYYGLAGLWTVFVFFVAARGVLRERLLTALFVLPLLVGFLFSFATPLLQYFRFLYLLPVLSLLLVAGTKSTKVRLTVLIGFVTLSLVYLMNPVFHREDWKSLAHSLPDRKTFAILPSSDALTYYHEHTSLHELRSVEASATDEREITVIPYTADIYALDYASLLSNMGFHKSEEKAFRGVTSETWIRN